MKPITAFLFAISFSLLVSGSASAQALAHASMSNLRFTLTDLDLNDGITPSLTYTPRIGIGPALITTFQHDPRSDYFNYTDVGINYPPTGLERPWDPLDQAIVHTDPRPSTQTRLETSSSLRGTSLDTLAMTSTSSAYSLLGPVTADTWVRSRVMDLTVSPMTALVILVDATLESSLGPMSLPDRSGFAGSYAYFNWTGPLVNGLPAWSQIEAHHEVGGFEPPDDPGYAGTRTLSIYYYNTSTDTLANELELRVDALAMVMGVVPEPMTYAMLLTGLALLGSARLAHAKKAPVVNKRQAQSGEAAL